MFPQTGKRLVNLKKQMSYDNEETKTIETFLEEIKGNGLNNNQQAFLVALVEHFGIVTEAARAAGISWQAHYQWMRKPDSKYPDCYELACELAKYRRLHEAYRRASLGVREPVFYQGEICGYIQKYSDTLMNTIIKGDFKKQYGDSSEHTIKREDEVMKKYPGRDELTDEDLNTLLATVNAIKLQREENE
jgi:hypothetical protein